MIYSYIVPEVSVHCKIEALPYQEDDEEHDTNNGGSQINDVTHVLVGEQVYIQTTGRLEPMCIDTYTFSPAEFAFLCTSRQVYREAHDVVYQAPIVLSTSVRGVFELGGFKKHVDLFNRVRELVLPVDAIETLKELTIEWFPVERLPNLRKITLIPDEGSFANGNDYYPFSLLPYVRAALKLPDGPTTQFPDLLKAFTEEKEEWFAGSATNAMLEARDITLSSSFSFNIQVVAGEERSYRGDHLLVCPMVPILLPERS
jgi:hypothetical protein